EHLMFKGTERFNKEAGTSVFQTLQKLGAQVNATTWLDRTNYYALLPVEHLEAAVEIEADRMRRARLDAASLESERTVILNELDRGENDPFRRLYHLVWSTAFLAHPYGHPTIGWRADVETVTPEGLRGFYDRFYWPDNATATVIGGVSAEDALALLERHFGAIPKAPAPPVASTTREPEQAGMRRVTLRQEAQLGTVVLAWKVPHGLHEDADALALLALALGTGKASRLYSALVDTGLGVFAGTSFPRLHDPGLFVAYAQPAPGHTHAEVEAAILEAVETLVREGVSETELARVQGLLRAQEAFARDGAFAAASQLNEAIAAGDWRLFATALDRAAHVTAENLQRVARTYLHEDALTVGWHLTEGRGPRFEDREE
ncbi:MAG TPA: pitrilysin family protein, partial [Rhodothermales bacterium]|nr:pitrilysin family protein [Rhodothermales bacterium]